MKQMRSHCLLLVLCALAPLAYGQQAGRVLFADDFNAAGSFAENWRPDKGARITPSDGAVDFAGPGRMAMARDTPRDFVVELDISPRGPAVAKSFCGFVVGETSLGLTPDGKWSFGAFPSGHDKRVEKSGAVEGFAPDRPVRLSLVREALPESTRWRFLVGGREVGSVRSAPMSDIRSPDPNPLRIVCRAATMRIDDFSLRAVRKGDESPNLIINSGFEVDVGGYPTYFCRAGNFKPEMFEKYDRYLDNWKVDTKERHSGRQSLRIVRDETSSTTGIWVWGAGTDKGKPGVLSAWMKSDTDGLEVQLIHGGGRDNRKSVKVGTEWKRYELAVTNSPGRWIYPSTRILLQGTNTATLWIDDIQAEILDVSPTAEELQAGKVFATPYRPSDADKEKFAPITRPVRADGFSIPLLPADTKPTAKLDEWKEKGVKVSTFWFKTAIPSRKTEAYLACDSENLYIGFRNFGEDRSLVRETPDPVETMAAFGQDGLELFFSVADERKWRHLVTTASGLRTDLFGEDVQWDGEWRSEAIANEAAGSVDYLVTIPFADFAGAEMTDRWMVNLCRNDVHGAIKEYLSTARTPIIWYRQQDFWPIVRLPEDIVKPWRIGATGAFKATTGATTTYAFDFGNNSGRVRHVTAELFDASTDRKPKMASCEWTIPPGSSSASLTCEVDSSKVFLVLTEKGRPLSRRLMMPVRRDPVSMQGRLDFYMDEKESVFRVTCNLPAPGELTALLECDGKKVTMKGAARFLISLPLDGLADGTHVATLKMLKGDGTVVASTKAPLIKRPYWEGATQINRFARCLQRKGKKLFVCGMAFAGRVPTGYADFLAANGFRHGHVLFGNRKDCVDLGEEFLRYTEEKGIDVILWTKYEELKSAEEVETMMRRFATKNILIQMVMDEPELGKPSDDARDYLLKMREKFPYHPVMMNNTMLGIPNRYADLETDVLMLDRYLTSAERMPVSDVVSSADDMWKAGAEEGKPCFYFLVSHNFPLHYKEPSYGEQIAQSYGCIAAGCSGISYYIDIPATRGSFEAMTQVNREVMEIEQPLLSEEECAPCGCDGDRKTLRHLTKRFKGALYVVTCNIDPLDVGPVSFSLPEGCEAAGKAEVLFEDRTLDITGGVFRDEFDGYERHVYKIPLK